MFNSLSYFIECYVPFVSVSVPAANIEQYESPVCARRLQQQPKDMEGEGEEREGKQDF